MQSSPAELSEFRALEQALHQAEVRWSRAKVEALLDESFLEFGASGAIYNRAQTVASLAGERGGEEMRITSSDYALLRISENAVLLTYESQHERRDGAREVVLRSSIWRRSDGCWRMLFHQGTVKQPS